MPNSIVLLRRLHTLAYVSLHIVAQFASAVTVQWKISLAWEDVSCDSVCDAASLTCVEACWPASRATLLAALQDPIISGTCFGVDGGKAALWNPVKDPDTMSCYWDGGSSASTQPRCGIKPSTPASLTSQNMYLRRICPCIPQSASTSQLDCNVGSQSVLVSPKEVAPVTVAATSSVTFKRSTTTSVITQRTSLASSSPAAATTLGSSFASQAPATVAQAVRPSIVCQDLCVSGFGAPDSALNGRYKRIPAQDDSLLHWLGLSIAVIITRGTDGRWAFLKQSQISAPVTLGVGSIAAAGGSEIPQDDYVMTPTSGFQVHFACCPTASAASLSFSSSGSATSSKDSNSNIVMGVIVGVVLAVVVLLGVALLLLKRHYPKLIGVRSYNVFLPTSKSLEEPDREMGLKQDLRSASAADSESDYLRDAASKETQAPQGRRFWRSMPGRNSNVPAKVGRPVPNQYGLRDDSAAAIAAVLGRDDSMHASNGTYEGPVRQWWKPDDTPSRHQRGGLGGTGFHIGSPVRLKGLLSQPTWNGTEGCVEGYDPLKGVLQIRVEDGRLKVVKPENCCAVHDVPRSSTRPKVEDPIADVSTKVKEQQPWDWLPPDQRGSRKKQLPKSSPEPPQLPPPPNFTASRENLSCEPATSSKRPEASKVQVSQAQTLQGRRAPPPLASTSSTQPVKQFVSTAAESSTKWRPAAEQSPHARKLSSAPGDRNLEAELQRMQASVKLKMNMLKSSLGN